MTPAELRKTIQTYYAEHGRDLPWRHKPYVAYEILVSEIMLQQTQVPRVVPEYNQFLHSFPSIQDLANAELGSVLHAWSGLGYNRRAKYLHDAAKILKNIPQPWGLHDLMACKGIGHNTAAAVMTYTYNQPVIFIETNIRAVIIHHFFSERQYVSDNELMPILESLLDRANPREFMWAMMDYGTHLKATVGNTAKRSKHFTKQSQFEGSGRQIRGQVIKLLTNAPRSAETIRQIIPDNRLESVLENLEAEGLIIKSRMIYQLPH